MSDLTVARTIIEQLGGQQFFVMTGARHVVAGRNWVAFKLPSYFAARGINAVRVTLDEAADLYRLEFSKVRGLKVTPIASHDGLYWDSLRAVFTRETGLDTHL